MGSVLVGSVLDVGVEGAREFSLTPPSSVAGAARFAAPAAAQPLVGWTGPAPQRASARSLARARRAASRLAADVIVSRRSEIVSTWAMERASGADQPRSGPRTSHRSRMNSHGLCNSDARSAHYSGER